MVWSPGTWGNEWFVNTDGPSDGNGTRGQTCRQAYKHEHNEDTHTYIFCINKLTHHSSSDTHTNTLPGVQIWAHDLNLFCVKRRTSREEKLSVMCKFCINNSSAFLLPAKHAFPFLTAFLLSFIALSVLPSDVSSSDVFPFTWTQPSVLHQNTYRLKHHTLLQCCFIFQLLTCRSSCRSSQHSHIRAAHFQQ